MSARERTRHRRGPSFYERALEAGDRDLFAAALAADGVDEEIALLRLQIHRLLEAQVADPSADPRTLQAGIRLLVHALVARHRLTGAEAETLTETASSLLEQFGALFAPVGGDAHG